MLEMSWSWTDRTNCKTVARSVPPPRLRLRRTRRTLTSRLKPRRGLRTRSRAHRARVVARKRHSRATPPLRSHNESVPAVHFAASCHHVVDGGNFVGGFCRLPSVARLRL